MNRFRIFFAVMSMSIFWIRSYALRVSKEICILQWWFVFAYCALYFVHILLNLVMFIKDCTLCSNYISIQLFKIEFYYTTKCKKYVKIWLNILKSCDSNNDDNSELKRRCQLHICGINFCLSQVKMKNLFCWFNRHYYYQLLPY